MLQKRRSIISGNASLISGADPLEFYNIFYIHRPPSASQKLTVYYNRHSSGVPKFDYTLKVLWLSAKKLNKQIVCRTASFFVRFRVLRAVRV